MIRMPPAVIPHHIADILRNRLHIADQLLDRFRFQIRLPGDRFIQIRYIRVVMFPVMNLHRLRVDVRFQCILGIRQSR